MPASRSVARPAGVSAAGPADPRKERARATRRRMVEAAYRLFCERGYGVPLTAVADEAGVAVQTVYFTFHNKLGLLQEALQFAVLGDDSQVPPHERPWFGEMLAEPDPRGAVAMVLDNTKAIYARVGPLSGVFQTGDPEVSDMWKHSEDLRYEGMRQMTTAILSKGTPKPGLDLDIAADVVFVLLSPATYQMFVGERGWEPGRWCAWVTDLIAGALFG